MKVCYVDESGNNTRDPCLVMVGVVVDTARLNRTREEFAGVFDIVQGLFEESLKELKGAKMVFGKDRWRRIDPKIRKVLAQFFCDWIGRRKHRLAVSAIDRAKLKTTGCDAFPALADNPWLAASLHIALQIQKSHQSAKANKGQTFLFVDENKQYADALAELLYEPPDWTDTYYARGKKQQKLDQLIDSAFAVKSHHAGLVQVADLYALLIRRYAELHDYGSAELWDGERALMERYVGTLAGRMFATTSRWPARPKCGCSRWFNAVAPDSLKKLEN